MSTDICQICRKEEDDIVQYGEKMRDGKVVAHYFCLLLSSALIPNGQDAEGICGFLKRDINAEIHRAKPLKCNYCKMPGASIGCCRAACRRSFHLPCAVQHNCLFEFTGTFRSFCHEHHGIKADKTKHGEDDACNICLTEMGPYHPVTSIRSPCCSSSSWYHKLCLMKMAQTSGYFFKCPLCNNENKFRDTLVLRGIFIPDCDAPWELEMNAYTEVNQKPKTCAASTCLCSKGRDHNGSEGTIYDFTNCQYCGSSCVHRSCIPPSNIAADISLDRRTRSSIIHDDDDSYVCTLCESILTPAKSSSEAPPGTAQRLEEIIEISSNESYDSTQGSFSPLFFEEEDQTSINSIDNRSDPNAMAVDPSNRSHQGYNHFCIGLDKENHKPEAQQKSISAQSKQKPAVGNFSNDEENSFRRTDEEKPFSDGYHILVSTLTSSRAKTITTGLPEKNFDKPLKETLYAQKFKHLDNQLITSDSEGSDATIIVDDESDDGFRLEHGNRRPFDDLDSYPPSKKKKNNNNLNETRSIDEHQLSRILDGSDDEDAIKPLSLSRRNFFSDFKCDYSCESAEIPRCSSDADLSIAKAETPNRSYSDDEEDIRPVSLSKRNFFIDFESDSFSEKNSEEMLKFSIDQGNVKVENRKFSFAEDEPVIGKLNLHSKLTKCSVSLNKIDIAHIKTEQKIEANQRRRASNS